MKKLFSPLFVFAFLFLFASFTFLSGKGVGGSALSSITRTYPFEIIYGKENLIRQGRYMAYGFPCIAFEVIRGTSGRANGLGQPKEPVSLVWKIDVPKLAVNLLVIFVFTCLVVKIITFGYRD